MHKKYDPDHYRVVFFSSAPIGVPFLEHLTDDKRFEVVWVVSQCDKPSGRWMEMNENIIKSEAKKIFSSVSKNSISKVIFIHGKNVTTDKSRYDQLKQDMKEKNIKILMPIMPHADKPVFEEWMEKIDTLKPDKNTILVGHSRWGVAILRWLENHPEIKVKKVIIIASNDGQCKYKEKKEDHRKRFTEEWYNFWKIKKTCNNFVIFHSKDDQRVDYRAGVENAKWLDAKLYTFEDRMHFGKNLTQKWFPELIPEIFSDSSDFIYTPTKLNPEKSEEGKAFGERIKEKQPDMLVVIAYGKIIPQAILDIPRIAPINVHGSLLPKYRGASPIQSTLLNNDKETWITIMKMDATMDTGNIIDMIKFTIPFQRTTKELIGEMKKIGPKFLNTTLRKYGKKLLGEVVQSEHQATYCGKIEKESWLINPRTESLETIYNKYRAFSLWPKIYFMLPPLIKEGDHDSGGGFKRVIIESLKLNESVYNSNEEAPIFQDKNLNPAILDIQLKPEGKKAMNWKEFLNGYMK